MIQCPVCHLAWCHQCNCAWHADLTCEKYKQWKRDTGVEGDAANKAWVEANAKLCPKCGAVVQKTTGCNCITCRCGKQFCWLCTADATGHKFACGHPVWS
mmetsp:Transcript_3733/g.6553  ORF Transcript_3733/g.6553 Transcript_3733/m.6553 type:complete len:100 (-) Transcript_3733:158-457(-)